MSIPVTNLLMTRGDTFTFNLTVTQSGAAFNLSGVTLRMTAKWSYADADNAAVFTARSPSNGIVITNAGGGLATVTLAPAMTSGLPPAQVNLYYDIQVTDGSGNIYTIAAGVLTVSPDVTLTTP